MTTAGHIRRRGRSSWLIKFDLPSAGGKRKTRTATVRGKRQDAQRELTRLLAESNNGTLVEPSKVTVAEHLRGWLGQPPMEGEPIPPPPAGITPKTAERYRELAEGQIIPHLGDLLLQKLKPTNNCGLA
jgi:integrase